MVRIWVDNIKMDLREVGWDGRDWINLAQYRDRWRAYVNAVMNQLKNCENPAPVESHLITRSIFPQQKFALRFSTTNNINIDVTN
jgi:hypothetical protein